jgi:Uma2 family endonuclease
MSVAAERIYSEAEYLEMERAAETKSEYIDGYIYAMAGATDTHDTICGNVFAFVHQQVRGSGCKVYTSNMRVRVSATQTNTYPDATIVCGDPQHLDERNDTLLNPLVIVEVLSKSTEAFDRGKKFQDYQKVETLQEYVLISQYQPLVERFARNSDGTWQLTAVEDTSASIALTSVTCTLNLSDIYEGVTFKPVQRRIRLYRSR